MQWNDDLTIFSPHTTVNYGQTMSSLTVDEYLHYYTDSNGNSIQVFKRQKSIYENSFDG